MVSKSMSNMAAELLKCTICYDSFKGPRVLPCLHTFCEECLKQHIDVNTRSKLLARSVSSPSRFNLTFPCPTCREQVRVPTNGVEGFRHDFRVTQFQDWLNQSSSSISTNEEESSKPQPQTSDPSTCHFCKSTNKESVTSYCKVCKKWLCEKCADRHQRKAIFSDHIIVPSAVESQVDMDSSECETHRGEHIAYICLKCNTGVCSVCTMTSHDSHAVTDLLSGLRGYHDNLECLQQALVMRVSQLFHFMKDITSQEKQLQQERTQTVTEIKTKTQEMIKSLREQERMLITEIESRYRTETDKLNTSKNEMELTIVSMESLREFSSDLLQKKNSLQLLPIYQDLTQRMDRILEDSLQLKTSYTHTNWKFVTSKNKCKLGKLKYTETNNNLENDVSSIVNITPLMSSTRLLHATALTKIGCHGNKLGEFDSPRDITFLLDGNFVVADTSNNRLQVFTADGSLVGIIGQGHIKPWGIATTVDGNIAVADAMDKCVKIFSSTGVLLAKFGQFLCPCGIAVDQGGDIFVTDFFSTSIYVLSSLGAMLHKYEFRDRNDRHASGASRIAISRRGTIIVSDISNCCVKIFNLSGKLLTKVSKPDLLGTPHGVTTDSQDNIYVGEMSKNQVIVLNPNGQYLHQLFSGHELRDPLGIAISKDNLLVLSEGKTNTVGIYRLSANSHVVKPTTNATESE